MLSTLLLLNVTLAALPGQCQAVAKDAPLEAYLVTTGPGRNMYTRVGHSAIWVSGGGQRELFFNWGAYDNKQENFLWKFFKGTAKYQLTMMTRKRNDRRIKREDQMLKAQHLNLSPVMKTRLRALLAEKRQPENLYYVYHWEKQNCATLLRDLLDKTTGGAYQGLVGIPTTHTYRAEILRHLASLPWAWFGWHFMASAYAEKTYDRWTLMHIPERLMEETGALRVTWEDGSSRPLVDRECILNEGSYGWTPREPPTRWPTMWLAGLILGLVFAVGIHTKERVFRIVSGLSMGLFFFGAGMLGSVFLFFWLTSQLDGYGPNENWFYANPLTLLMVPYAIGLTLGKRHWTQRFASIPMFLGAVALVGMVLNPFTDQVNLDFIGLFGLPLVLVAGKLIHARRGQMELLPQSK